jgi:hypothetical protein
MRRRKAVQRAFVAQLIGIVAVVLAGPVYAAQPLATDDAAVLPPRTCQVEAWIERAHDAREHGIAPACNFSGNLELGAGIVRVRPDADDRSSVLQLQAKTVLYPRANGAWSFGAVGGAVRDTTAPHGRSAFQTFYGKGLASWYPLDDVQVDINLGFSTSHESGTSSLAGVALQYTLTANVQLLAELFRDEPGRGKFQVGVRLLAIPDRFETFIGYVDQLGAGSRSSSVIIGFRAQAPAWRP